MMKKKIIQNLKAEDHNDIALKYLDKNEPTKAIRHFKKAIKLNSSFVNSYFNLGLLYRQLGEPIKAITILENALKIDKNNINIYYLLSSIDSYSFKSESIEKMKNLIKTTHHKPDLIHLNFALFKAFEKQNELDLSFFHLNTANQLKKETLNYNFKSDLDLFDSLKKINYENFTLKNPAETKIPIFIVGMPRSGTTLVEQILSSHSKVQGGGELYLVTKSLADDNFGYNRKGISLNEKYFQEINKLKISKKFFTDKMPLNFRWIGFILSQIPEAKIVHVLRNPIATCWSIYKHNFSANGNEFAYDQTDIVNYYYLYNELMGLWHHKFPDKIMDVNYELLVNEQEKISKDILNFCNLSWEPQCLNFHTNQRRIKTASSLQVRKPIYKDSNNDWKRYERHLLPMINLLNSKKINHHSNNLTNSSQAIKPSLPEDF